MGKFDHGLGAIGALSLTAALAVLLTAGIPILLAGDPLKVSDWLGFAGSFAGAMVALIAAVIAWRAVQRQIETQMRIADRQSALAEYEALRKLSTIISNENIIARRLRYVSFTTTLAETYQFKVEFISFTTLDRETSKLKKRLKRLKKIGRDFLKIATEINPVVNTPLRSEIYTLLVDLRSAVSNAILELERIGKNRIPEGSILNSKDAADCKAITVKPQHDAIHAAIDKYLVEIEQESLRIMPLLTSAQARAAL